MTDNYTVPELLCASIWCLDAHSTPVKMYVGARDRAMLLLSTCTAFHGDNIRSLLLSDLFARDIPMVDKGLEHQSQ